ncbi:MAG TPA: ABC transporter ATP-binding protein, partial [Caulobacteraceae bacterium]|nr:ABC transporter ATP-binding protein [Caulobacteraceae bacterium]
HLLILDEPTNHLDIDSRRALLDALNDYDGAVVIITHDRSLMDLVADRLWLTADGTVKPFQGDLDDYTRFVLDRAKAVSAGQAKPRAEGANSREARKAASAARMRIMPLKNEVQALEKKMDSISWSIGKLDQALADPELFSRDPDKAVSLGKDRARAQEELAETEAKWLAAAETYEAAKVEAGLA